VIGPVEACFLIGESDGVLWAERSSNPISLPDSRVRWEAMWRHRDVLAIVAHTHPSGPLAFSSTDRSTMVALDAALGRCLTYAVVTREGMLRCTDGVASVSADEPWWTWLLRLTSGMAELDVPLGQLGDGQETTREDDRWRS
jgi:Prokaryotic homologs of the JAB domain